MSRVPLPQTDLLDARSPAGPEIRGAVAIPWLELSARRSELPERGSTLRVIGPPEAFAALRELGFKTAVALAPNDSVAGRRRLFGIEPLLEELVPASPAEAYDLGCGAGREAAWLAAAGWRVTAVDRLPERTEQAARLAARYGGAISARAERVESFLADAPPADLLLLLRCWDAAFVPLLARTARTGATVLAVTFAENDAKGVSPARTLSDADLHRLSIPFEIVRDAVAPRGERRVREVVLRRR